MTGIDPVEIRRRNFIAADAFPYQTPVALLYDSGDYERALDIALEKSDWNGFGRAQERLGSRRQAARYRPRGADRGDRGGAVGDRRPARRPRGAV